MKPKTKERIKLALYNAAELIRGQTEVGFDPEDVGEVDEEGLEVYAKATRRAAKLIETLAKRYQIDSMIPD